MRKRIPYLYWPTKVTWNLDGKSRAVMGKKWCEAYDAKVLKMKRLENWYASLDTDTLGVVERIKGMLA